MIHAAHHQQRRLQKVAYGIAFAQELRVRYDRKAIGTAQTLGGQFLACAWKNGAAHRQNQLAVSGLPRGGYLAADPPQLIQPQISVPLGGCAHADQGNIRLLDSRFQQRGCRQAAVRAAFLDQFRQPGFVERGPPGLDALDLVLIPIDAGYAVTQMRQASSRD